MFDNFQLSRITDLLQFNPDSPLIFSTGLFIFLFFGFLLIYNLLTKYKNARLYFLIFFSVYFYYKSAGYLASILILSAVINFYFGKLISTSTKPGIRRLFLIVSIIANLGILSYFKYTNFIIEIINGIQSAQITPLDIFLPIGISFYTFKSMSYIFDVYMEMMEPTKSFRDFCVFVFFFPNILAGPIDRASEFIPQINKEPFLTKEDLGKALFLIILGLIKKIVIADYISLNFVDRVFDFPLRYTGFENLVAIYGYTLQIYCDFSGYSDMAIGIALLMGFKLMDNFNSPFKAVSIADFWRRWHISLSSWLLDYLFKPLQMKFRNLRQFSNVIGLFVTFLLCGLWHGAGWNFIFWGALHGIFMSFSLMIKKPKEFVQKKLHIHNTVGLKFLQRFITFNLVAFSFLIFRLRSFDTIYEVIDQIFSFFHGEILMQFLEKMPLISGLLILGYLFHFMPDKVEIYIKKFITSLPLVGKAILLALVIWIVAQFKSADMQPFIYFQF